MMGSHMSHIRKFNPRKEKDRNPLKLKNDTYYVVAVKFNGANSEHNAIYHYRYDGHGQLFNGSYEEVYELYYLSLYSFRVIEEITAMEPEWRKNKEE